MLGSRRFRMAGWLAVCAWVVTSCAKEEIMDGRHLDRDAIAFGIVAGGTDTKALPERALPPDDTSVRLLAKGGTDTLYLHPSVEQNLAVPSAQQVATKGVPVTTDNFQTQCQSFSVTAYAQEDGNLFMNNVEVGQYANGIWSPNGDTRYWPSDDAVLAFYAHAPYAAALETLKYDDASLSFSYTTPTSGTDGKKDAEVQPDIMFAYQACSRSTTNAKGAVPLTFEHALAGVKFVANDIAGSTIKTITLKNLYGQGTCTYTAPAENAESGIFAWEVEGEKKDFCQAFNVKVEENPGHKQDITDVRPETTFMMIPQSLEGVEVEITLTTSEDGEEFTLIGSLAQAGKWEAGKIYTYSISTESINWEYVFEVTDKVTFALGETRKTYEVTSYRFRIGDPDTREAVAWKAENKSFSETDSETGSVVSGITLDKILSRFTYEGNGQAGNAVSYNVEVSETTLNTTYDGDKELKNNSLKGSEDNPYDLSTHDEKGGSIAQTTANCYVVNSGGTYMFPLVYGNAIKGGSENSAAYSGGRFNDYIDRPITNSRITGADDAVLVWSDGFYMFKDIHLNKSNDYLVFTIDPDYMQQANAVLAVRDAQDRIMWSWHIWVTNHEIYSPSYQHVLEDLFEPSNTYTLMGCNLGWVDEKMVYYNQRDLSFTFTQERSGKTLEMTVEQEGAEFDYKDVGSTYYQWGRKDPLVAMKNWEKYGPEDYRLHETGDPSYVYRIGTGGPNISLGDAIQHPNVFYTRGSGSNEGQNWCNENITTLWNNRDDGGNEDATTSTKTIYDPSPRGFKVPIPRAFAVLVNGSTGDGGNQSDPSSVGSLNGFIYTDGGEPYNKYRAYPKSNRQGSEIPLTGTGQRADVGGILEVYDKNDPIKAEVGGLWSLYGVYYWTCVPRNANSANTLVIRRDQPSGYATYSYLFTGTKTMARPVRCIVDR